MGLTEQSQLFQIHLSNEVNLESMTYESGVTTYWIMNTDCATYQVVDKTYLRKYTV